MIISDSKYLKDPSNDPELEPLITVDNAHWLAFLDELLGRSEEGSNGALRLECREGDITALICVATGTELMYRADEWSAFLSGVADGELRPDLLAA